MCNRDLGFNLRTSRVGTTPPRGGEVGRGRWDADADTDVDADADEEGEAIEGGDLGEDEELIGRGGDDTVDVEGGRCWEGSGGRDRGIDKATTEDRGSTPEGRGEG